MNGAAYGARWAPLPLRLALGYGFMYHGAPKLFNAAYHASFVGSLQGIHVPLPGVAAWVVGVVEFLGGLALIFGILRFPTTILLIIDMLVALFTVHLGHGYSFINITGMTASGPTFGMPGFEVNVLYIAGLLSLLLGGYGIFAADSLAARRPPGG
jgi:putative oxidoreductase